MLEFTEDVAAHQISFEAYGNGLRVCSNAADILARIEAVLPPGWRLCAQEPEQQRMGILAEDDGTFSVYHGSVRVSEGQGLELSLMVLDGELRGFIALNSPDRTFIHAGAVGHGGRAIIFPGHSFAGKTTLVAALVRAGADYYSDEFSVLDPAGLIHPYAKPLSLRSDPPIQQVETAVEQLGGLAGVEPLQLGLVVFTYYRPGAQWQPKRISAGQAALALLTHTMGAQVQPDRALKSIRLALEDAVALEGERGEADDIAERLLETVHA